MDLIGVSVGKEETNSPVTNMEPPEIVVVSPDITDNRPRSLAGPGSRSSSSPYPKYYKQAYRTSWESQPDFKGWLRGVEGQPSRAFCSYCQVTLFAHRLSLLKHTCTRKHQKATHRIFLKHSEKGGDGNDTENTGDEDYAEEADTVEDTDPKNNVQPTPASENSVERRELMGKEDKSNKMQLRLKQKSQQASGMTVTIIREDGTSDPLHLEVSDYSGINKPSSRAVPVAAVESTQPETPAGNTSKTNDNIAQSDHAEDSAMAQNRTSPLTTHVLDTAKGTPVHGIKVSLYRLIEGRWTLVNESVTSPDGRCNELIEEQNFVSGRYKLHFDVDRYFEFHRQESLYPFVEIVFDVHTPQVHYHIPLLISPYGYTTYRGS